MFFSVGERASRKANILSMKLMSREFSKKIQGADYGTRIRAPPMVYISGEEMTKYTMDLIKKTWIDPYLDTSLWEYFDMSCKYRDDTNDQVLHDAVNAGKRIGAIFKEPTITPTASQVEDFGLSQALKSPNGAMRKGWNGITISRDTIHIQGVELGFEKPVLFERHAVGGEYGAGWKQVGSGRLVTQFFPSDGSEPVLCDDRLLQDTNNVVVTYHNPLDNVKDLAHHFFSRCLKQGIVPYVVTKKTVFKWQEPFWLIMKEIFDKNYKQSYLDADLLPEGELQHLISDAATMQIIRWTGGGFGMAAHNYDGDMLTDEVAQVHRSPGFITSNLIGKRDDGTLIKEFEASHGTVADLWSAHQRGEETSMNPLGMVEAVIGALLHSASLVGPGKEAEIGKYCKHLRNALHNTFRYGQGTRDMAGPSGLTTEEFIDKVGARLARYIAAERHEEDEQGRDILRPDKKLRRNYNVDRNALEELFAEFDKDKNGSISMDELEAMLIKLAVAPVKDAQKIGSASSDKVKD
jgi:isocitrate dehydrogenase